MSSAVLCAVMLSVTVDYGYEAMPGDGIRYVIQIEPAMLDLLRSGQTVGSTIPPEIRGRLHAFRVVSNHDPLQKEIPPLPEGPENAGPLPPEPTNQPKPDVTIPPPPVSWQTDWFPEGASSASAPSLLPDQGKVIPASGTQEEPRSTDGPSGWPQPEDANESKPSERDPWFLLVLLVAAGSSSGMVFFGWLAYDYRSRYLGLLQDSTENDGSWLDDVGAPDDREPVARNSDDSTLNSERSKKGLREGQKSDDAAWRDPDSQPGESLDDWLDKEDGRKKKSRRDAKD